MLQTQPNSFPQAQTHERHRLPLPQCCPISGNPQPGSVIEISYRPNKVFLEVYSLRNFIDQFIGGYEDVRDMEGMIQKIAIECANAVGVHVRVVAAINLQDGDQLHLTVRAKPLE